MIKQIKSKFVIYLSIFLLLFGVISPLLTSLTVKADTISSLQAQKNSLDQQAQNAQSAAAQNQTIAQRAAARLQVVTSQINDLQSSINNTQNQINSLGQQIDQKNQDIAQLQSNLRNIQDQQNAIVRQLYIIGTSQQETMQIFSNQSVSKQQQNNEQFSSLEKVLSALASQTQAAKVIAQQAHDSLVLKQNELNAYQSQQTTQQNTLADVQSQQQSLQSNAVAAQQAYEAQAQAAKSKADALGRRIDALMAESWGGSPTGNRLIPVASYGWYYSQQNSSWAGDTMGYSPYTIGQFGCLITSIAMIAKHKGESNVTPRYIADNGNFTGDGYYISGPQGISEITAGTNWNYINSQIAMGNPVIVRLNLSSYWTHFVVIYAKSGSNYLIQDPWSPTGSGYSTSLVSGYGIVSGL
jgi:peptidoglycan hydrolase CwlO-like protein